MRKYKVVIVDDSAFMRKVISDIIDSSDEFEVVAKFRNGSELINKVDIYKPDIITLDIEMPNMNGLETLKELKKRKKNYPVIMLSSLTKEGSNKTIECLENGAVDFIAKPSNAFSNMNEIQEVIIEKLKAVSSILSNKEINKQMDKTNYSDNRTSKKEVSIRNKRFDAVIIGASTGGPKALQKVLTQIDGDINVPVFVVQHMPSGFTKAFADRLDRLCKLRVVEAEDGMNIESNTIYIAKGGQHMLVGNNKQIKLNDEPAIWGVRPAVDKLFFSAVNVYGGNLLAVILTGMGRDGADGIVKVKDAGGVTISEDESTCTIYGMPKAAYETGKVDMVLELQKIGKKINNVVKGR